MPRLLLALMSPAPGSWRRGGSAKAAKRNSASFLQQLPHFGFAEAVDGPSDLEDLDEDDGEDEAPPSPYPRKGYRDEYKPSDFTVDSVELLLKLDWKETKVSQCPTDGPGHMHVKYDCSLALSHLFTSFFRLFSYSMSAARLRVLRVPRARAYLLSVLELYGHCRSSLG